MKTEDHAWRALQTHASAQLHGRFADRVLRAAHGPQAETWQALQSHAARQLRPGFAERVLRAARELPGKMPSLFDQFTFGAATAAVCILTVVVIQNRTTRLEDERNLATWEQLAMQVDDADNAR